MQHCRPEGSINETRIPELREQAEADKTMLSEKDDVIPQKKEKIGALEEMLTNKDKRIDALSSDITKCELKELNLVIANRNDSIHAMLTAACEEEEEEMARLLEISGSNDA